MIRVESHVIRMWFTLAPLNSDLMPQKKFLSGPIGSPNPENINPDTWFDEYSFLKSAMAVRCSIGPFCDYQNNVKLYQTWQKWLRSHQPPLLVLWGRFDPSFTVAGAEAYPVMSCGPARLEVYLHCKWPNPNQGSPVQPII